MVKEYYNIKELQEIFGCGRSKAYKLLKEGVPHIRMGRSIYIPIKEFEEWRKERLIRNYEGIEH